MLSEPVQRFRNERRRRRREFIRPIPHHTVSPAGRHGTYLGAGNFTGPITCYHTSGVVGSRLHRTTAVTGCAGLAGFDVEHQTPGVNPFAQAISRLGGCGTSEAPPVTFAYAQTQ